MKRKISLLLVLALPTVSACFPEDDRIPGIVDNAEVEYDEEAFGYLRFKASIYFGYNIHPDFSPSVYWTDYKCRASDGTLRNAVFYRGNCHGGLTFLPYTAYVALPNGPDETIADTSYVHEMGHVFRLWLGTHKPQSGVYADYLQEDTEFWSFWDNEVRDEVRRRSDTGWWTRRGE